MRTETVLDVAVLLVNETSHLQPLQRADEGGRFIFIIIVDCITIKSIKLKHFDFI